MDNLDFEDQRNALKVLAEKPQTPSWFDNKRTYVPQKQEREKLDIKSLTDDELLERYNTCKFEVETINEVGGDSKKITKFLIVLKSHVRERGLIDAPKKNNINWQAKYNDLHKEFKSIQAELSALKMESNNLKNQLASKREAEKIKRIEISNNHEVKFHQQFRRVVKDQAGEAEYISMVKIANTMMDSE